jgi:hypothetical protein
MVINNPTRIRIRDLKSGDLQLFLSGTDEDFETAVQRQSTSWTVKFDPLDRLIPYRVILEAKPEGSSTSVTFINLYDLTGNAVDTSLVRSGSWNSYDYVWIGEYVIQEAQELV